MEAVNQEKNGLVEFIQKSAIAQMISSERVIGALLLIAVVGLTLLAPQVFADYQEELGMILAALIAQFVGLHTYVKVSAGEMVLIDDQNRPLLEPLKKLWQSRKFMTTLIGLGLELLVIYLHLPEEMKTQLLGLILLAVMAYNGAIAAEDAKKNALFPEASKRAI